MDVDARLDAGRKFKAMYRSLDMDLVACAQFLQVSERTVHNWQSGRHVIPFAVFKLLRLLNHMDLPGSTWGGWSFVGGRLVSPEGRTFLGTDGSWWGLLVRRAAMFDALYCENVALRAKVAAGVGDRHAAGAGLGGVRQRAPQAGPAACGWACPQYQQRENATFSRWV